MVSWLIKGFTNASKKAEKQKIGPCATTFMRLQGLRGVCEGRVWIVWRGEIKNLWSL